MLSASAGWARAPSTVDSGEDSEEDQAVDPKADPDSVVDPAADQVAEVGVVDEAAVGVEVVDAAGIRRPGEVLIMVSSPASATGGVNSLRTPVLCLSRYKIRR
jgi:hypothetical protein